MSHQIEKPAKPDLPQYVVDDLERQDPGRLDEISAWAAELAEWKRHQADLEAEQRLEEEGIDEEERVELEAREDVSIEPGDYEGVPGGAYITIKETKPGYHYYYWQWRAGPDTWKNEYIGPVDLAE